MTDKEYIEGLTIWCTYHNDQIIDEYNLNYIPSYIKLFNTNDLNVDGEHINHLCQHLCEICTIYYVWKNQIYSKYVGFCHYRRFYDELGKSNIEKYGMHCYSLITDCLASPKNSQIQDFSNIINKLYIFLKDKNQFNKDFLYDCFYNENKSIHIPWQISYILNWDLFNKACDLYFGFLIYLFGDFTDLRKYENTGRSVAWMSEPIFGIIICILCHNVFFFNEHHNFYYFIDNQKKILTKTNDIEKAHLWLKKNNRSNAKLIIISNNFNKDQLNNYPYNHIWSEDYEIIENENQIINNKDIIILEINEYVKCLDPIEFRKGNYTIEKF